MAIRYSQARSQPRPANVQALPGAEQGVLEGVVGVLDRAQHPVAVGAQLGPVGLDQPGEGLVVAAQAGPSRNASRVRTPQPLAPLGW